MNKLRKKNQPQTKPKSLEGLDANGSSMFICSLIAMLLYQIPNFVLFSCLFELVASA